MTRLLALIAQARLVIIHAELRQRVLAAQELNLSRKENDFGIS